MVAPTSSEPSWISRANACASGRKRYATSSSISTFWRLHHVEHVAPVLVVDHAALGRPGGAGGVDVGGDVGALDRRDALLVVLVGAAAALLAQLVQADHVVAVERLHGDHVLELRQVAPDLADLVELALVLEDHRHGLGVIEHVVAFLRRVRLVDRHDGGAGGQDPEVGVGPLGPRVGEDADLVAAVDAELLEAERDLLRDLAQLRIGDVDPFALGLVLVLLGDLVGVLLDGQGQQVRECLRPGRRCARGRGRLSLHRVPPHLGSESPSTPRKLEAIVLSRALGQSEAPACGKTRTRRRPDGLRRPPVRRA